MEYKLRQLQSCTSNSIQHIVSHSSCFTVVIMKKNGLAAYLSVDHDNETITLDSAGIKATAHTTVCMNPGLHIERTYERARGSPQMDYPVPTLDLQKVNYPMARKGTKSIRPMCSGFSLDRTVRTMQESDYFQISFRPVEVRSSNAFDEATNQRYMGQQCFLYEFTASSVPVANALIDDLSCSQADFRLNADDGNHPHTHRINSHLMTKTEALLVANAFDTLLSHMLRPSIDSLMDPGTVQSFGCPDITVGFHNGIAVGLSHKHLVQNVGVLGAVYSGKSKLLSSVTRQLQTAGIPTLIIAPVKHDFSAEFPSADLYRSGSTERPLRFNILDLPYNQGSSKLAAAALTCMVSMGGSDSVLPIILENALQGLYAAGGEVTLPALAAAVRSELKFSAYKEANSLTQAAVTRLKALAATSEFNCGISNIDFSKIFQPGQITILELNDMEPEFRRAFSTLFLERLREKYMSLPNIGRDKPRLICIIDETHELLHETPSIRDPFRDVLNNSLNTASGQAIGFVLADQRPELIAELISYGCSSHIFMRGFATEQAASVLRLPMDSPMLGHLSRLKVGESLLHVVGEDTIAVGAAPLLEPKADTLPSELRSTHDYCPYGACKKVCATCNGKIHSAASQAVLSQLHGPAYTAYRNAGTAHEQATAAYKRAYDAHLRNPQSVPEPTKPAPRKEVILRAKTELIKACSMEAVKKARNEGLDLTQIGAVLRHCTEQELVRQMAFRLDA